MKKLSRIIAFIVTSIISFTGISFSQWVQTSFPGSDVKAFAVSGIYLFADNGSHGVFSSTDNGTSWTQVNNGLKDDNFITGFATKCTYLFAGMEGRGGGGIFLSSDNGYNWTNINAEKVYDVSALTTDSANIYAAAYNGLYRSTDNGSSWTKLSDVPPPNTLAIGKKGLFAGTESGVFYSPDKGDNWIHSNDGLMDTSISALAVYADSILAGTSTGVYFSSDFGVHWNQSITGLTDRRIHCFATNGTNVFVGTEQGVFMSTNFGRQWSQINDGLPPNTSINALVVSDSFLIAGSTLNGEVWRRILTDIKPPIQCDSLVDIFPLSVGDKWTYNYSLNSNDEFAGRCTVSGTFFFQIIGKSFTSESIIWKMQKVNNLNYNHNGVLSRDTNISTFNLIEINNGDHRVYSSGFPFYSMPFDSISFNRYAYVDTDSLWNFEIDKGRMKYTYTFKRDIGAISYSAMDMCTCLDYWYESYGLSNSHITGVETHREMNYVKEFRLNQNYPNPFNPSTTISFNIPLKSFVTIKIFDFLGREVAILINKELSAGNYTQQWNAINLSSGVYFCRLQAGSFIETKKLVLLR